MEAARQTAPAAAALEVLGDERRREIVRLLGERERSVRELADQLPVSRPAVSRHLRLLKEAGLVSDRAVGTRRLYSLEPDGIAAARAYFDQLWGNALARFRWSPTTTNHTRPLPTPIATKVSQDD